MFVAVSCVASVVVYLRCAERAEQFLSSPRAQMTIRLPPSEKKSKSPKGSGTATARRKAATDSDGWIETQKTGSTVKRRRSSSASTRSSKGKRKKSTAAKTKPKKSAGKTRSNKGTKTKKSSTAKGAQQPNIIQLAGRGKMQNRADPPREAEIIDIDTDDDSTSFDETTSQRQQDLQRPQRKEPRNVQQQPLVIDDLMVDTDQDEEYEFEV